MTAKGFIEINGFHTGVVNLEDWQNLMIVFAKLKVKEALESASEKARVRVCLDLDYDDNEKANRHIDYFEVSKKSILNSYPETNII